MNIHEQFSRTESVPGAVPQLSVNLGENVFGLPRGIQRAILASPRSANRHFGIRIVSRRGAAWEDLAYAVLGFCALMVIALAFVRPWL